MEQDMNERIRGLGAGADRMNLRGQVGVGPLDACAAMPAGRQRLVFQIAGLRGKAERRAKALQWLETSLTYNPPDDATDEEIAQLLYHGIHNEKRPY